MVKPASSRLVLTHSIRGFSLIEATVVALIVAVVSVGITQLMNSTLKTQMRSTTTSSLDIIRRNFVAHIENNAAWSKTIADVGGLPAGQSSNPSFSCVRNSTSCTHNGNSTTATTPGVPLQDQPFRLRDAANNVVYDTVTDPTEGFDVSGKKCQGFSSTGNDACPFQYQLTWSAQCTGTCVNPQIRVKGTMLYRPASQKRTIALSTENYSFDVVVGGAAAAAVPVPPTCTGNNSLHWTGTAWSCDVVDTFAGTPCGANNKGITMYGPYSLAGSPGNRMCCYSAYYAGYIQYGNYYVVYCTAF